MAVFSFASIIMAFSQAANGIPALLILSLDNGFRSGIVDLNNNE
jgi:hypothetical protein